MQGGVFLAAKTRMWAFFAGSDQREDHHEEKSSDLSHFGVVVVLAI